jgi:putative transposase
LYLAIVLDVWSRPVVDWAIGDRAAQARRGYLSATDGASTPRIAFDRCRRMGVRPSTGTVGDAYDNAMAESFFASLECELLDRRSFKAKTEARLAVFTWIEGWYNPRRRHSALGYQSPINYERRNPNPHCQPPPTTTKIRTTETESIA